MRGRACRLSCSKPGVRELRHGYIGGIISEVAFAWQHTEAMKKTDLSGFRGFSFGAKSGTSGPAAKAAATRPTPGAATVRPATAKQKPGVAALFAESLEVNSGAATAAAPSWSKLSIEAVAAQRHAEALQASDPTVFQYDEVIDDVQSARDVEGPSQAVRTSALEQKKRVGLVIPQGGAGVATGSRRTSKYIENVIVATDRRRAEQQIVEDKLLRKDKDKFAGCETFVTSGFKEELKRRKKFEEELERQDYVDKLKAAEKQSDGKGFADMYRNLLNGGLATSRGGEKLKEQAPAYEEDMKQEAGDDVKEEKVDDIKDEVKDEVKKETVKSDEDGADSSGAHGVREAQASAEDGAPAAKRPRKEDEAEERQEKAMSARERFLARKKAAAASADAPS